MASRRWARAFTIGLGAATSLELDAAIMDDAQHRQAGQHRGHVSRLHPPSGPSEIVIYEN